ncbi:prothymosin alpha-B-like [Thunnus maccoyii]|uniref:prothymosin alpha-B-like n=1 Tax=Thunnus maccoyii TaxID=8240 RepID=UPI001C4CE5DD|nr:prothymosin alpha-B-like [Thunnus maccoyii]
MRSMERRSWNILLGHRVTWEKKEAQDSASGNEDLIQPEPDLHNDSVNCLVQETSMEDEDEDNEDDDDEVHIPGPSTSITTPPFQSHEDENKDDDEDEDYTPGPSTKSSEGVELSLPLRE